MPNPTIVWGEGPKETCKICIIGEAPGEVEVRETEREQSNFPGRATYGKPFCGPAGHLLNECLVSAYLNRSQIYITNVVKERPPKNDIEKFIKFKKGGAETTAEFDRYVEILREELQTCSANVFVLVGAVPLWVFMHLTMITKRRGSIYESDFLGRKVKAIPIIHPSAALRQYLFKYFIMQDLVRVREESEFPEVVPPNYRILIPDERETLGGVLNWLKNLNSLQTISYDIEVMRGEVACIAFAHEDEDFEGKHIFSKTIAFLHEGQNYWTPENEALIWQAISRLLENPNVKKIGQNIIFDSHFLFRKYGIITRNMGDTMIAAGIAHPQFPKGLDFLTSIHTRQPYYKDDGKTWFKLGLGSWETFWRYNALDAATTLDCYPEVLHDLERQGNITAYEERLRLIEPLTFMQEHGMRVNVAGLRAASREAGDRIELLTTELQGLVGYPINPNSPKQVAQLFYVEKGIKAYVNRKTHTVTTDEQALKRLSRRGFREAEILLEIRHWQKLKSTYLDVQLDSDERLRCSYNPVGTTSGRLSSSANIFGTGTNVQNLPPEMQQFIIADDGYLLFNVDLSQAENRVVAYIAPETRMQQAFENGEDMHRLTASLIFNKPASEISDEKGSSPLAGGAYSERFWGKKANHSLNYDLSYKGFALQYEMPEAEAQLIVEGFHRAYPGIRKYHAWVRNEVSRTRFLTDAYGKKRLFLGRLGSDLFKEAYSHIPQSTVAHKINHDGIEPMYYNKRLISTIIMNQIHDSIPFQRKIPAASYLSESWIDIAEELIYIKTLLETPITWNSSTQFKILADFKVGLNVRDMKEITVDASDPNGLAKQLSEIYREIRIS